MSRFLPPASRISRVYIESFTGFRHVCHPGGPNNPFLSQVCVLETARTVGTVGQMMYIPRTREGVKSVWLPRSSSQFNQGLRHLDDLQHLQRFMITKTMHVLCYHWGWGHVTIGWSKPKKDEQRLWLPDQGIWHSPLSSSATASMDPCSLLEESCPVHSNTNQGLCCK